MRSRVALSLLLLSALQGTSAESSLELAASSGELSATGSNTVRTKAIQPSGQDAGVAERAAALAASTKHESLRAPIAAKGNTPLSERRRRRTKGSSRRRRRSSRRRRRKSSTRRRRRKAQPTEAPKEPETRRRSKPSEPETRRRSKPPSGPTGPKPKCWKPTPKDKNPFLTRKGNPQTYYVNPSYKESLQKSIKTASGKIKKTLEKMQNVPSAFWIDVKSKMRKGGTKEQPHSDINTVEGILEDAAKCDPPQLVLLMVYDLPNRDCFALASNGEICCHYGENIGRTSCEFEGGFYKEYPGAGCKEGLKEYQTTYIDPFVKVVKEYEGRVPIVLVIEPDSLPNMITNMAGSKPVPPGGPRGCNEESKVAYMEGIKYTVNAFADTEASMYLDAGHGGWLGWANPEDDKPGKFMALIKEMGIHTKMRGFATNVANYQTIGVGYRCPELGQCRGGNDRESKCCKHDPCKLASSWNWAHTEINYVDVLADRAVAAMPDWDVKFIVDTGRNGKPEARESCTNWCNPRGNGIGHVPTTSTNHEKIDAYYWLKTPGESDGCTEELPGGGKCGRFDKMCASDDSIGSKTGEPRAPEAGLWFDYQIKDLAENADLGDPWWVDLYQKGLQCRADDGGCADPMPMPTTTTTTLGPGSCAGQHGGCSGAANRADCYKVSSGCQWSGCCGGGACKGVDHSGWACPGKSEGDCTGDSKCKWEDDTGIPR